MFDTSLQHLEVLLDVHYVQIVQETDSSGMEWTYTSGFVVQIYIQSKYVT